MAGHESVAIAAALGDQRRPVMRPGLPQGRADIYQRAHYGHQQDNHPGQADSVQRVLDRDSPH